VSGSATIGAASPSTLQVDQHTKIVIIDWSSFNIAGGETTKFNQPSASAMAVNSLASCDRRGRDEGPRHPKEPAISSAKSR
jgi:hypothetical protein